MVEEQSATQVAMSKYDEGMKFKEEDQHVEALKKFDEAQNLLKNEQHEESIAILQSVHNEIAISCNVLSMGRLQSGDYRLAQDLLKKAELFSENNDRLRAVTYNNYACLFRKTNQLRNALSYLEMALELEYRCINGAENDQPVSECLIVSNPAEIHLNICAILSQLGKHELALHHAMKALILIQDEVLQLSETRDLR